MKESGCFGQLQMQQLLVAAQDAGAGFHAGDPMSESLTKPYLPLRYAKYG
jgi:hypothetical protein